MPEQTKYHSKRHFLWRNLLRGFVFLVLIIAAYILFKNKGGMEYISWLEPIYGQPTLMFLIYTASEILFGIIPPELFMVWALNQGDIGTYASIIALLMFISYGAGWLAYYVGKRSRNSPWYRFLKRKYFSKYETYLQEFGSFLIIVASVTPLPYAAICMLVGAADYKVSKFGIYSLFRLLRFIVYASIIWEANTLS